jgi:hypothetical protein
MKASASRSAVSPLLFAMSAHFASASPARAAAIVVADLVAALDDLHTRWPHVVEHPHRRVDAEGPL